MNVKLEHELLTVLLLICFISQTSCQSRKKQSTVGIPISKTTIAPQNHLSHIQETTDECKTDELKITLDLIKEGNQRVQLSENYRDMILMLGNTGAGKTTLTKFIAMKVNDMESYYDHARGGFLIRDAEEKIGTDSTITSKTIFPELFIDAETDYAFYDMPGFSDTRTPSIELANSLFIKKVADHALRVKIILIVNHSSLRQGESRNGFINVLQHTSLLLKNTTKFSDAIGIIATKVESALSSDMLVRGIAAFLRGARTDLHKIIQDRRQLQDAVNLIDAMITNVTTTNGEVQYTRIGLMRSPDQMGPLNEILITQNCKPQLKQIIFNNTLFASTTPDDFDVPLSSESNLLARRLIEIIGQNLINTMKSMTQDLVQGYATRFGVLDSNSCDYLSELLRNCEIIRNGTAAMTRVKDQEGFKIILLDTVSKFNDSLLDQFRISIGNIQFLNKASAHSSPSWFRIFDLRTRLIEFEELLNQEALRFMQAMDVGIVEWAQIIANNYSIQINDYVGSADIDLTIQLDWLSQEMRKFSEIKGLVLSSNGITPKQFASETVKILRDSIGESLSESNTLTAANLFCDGSHISENLAIGLKPLTWVAPFDHVIQSVETLTKVITRHNDTNQSYSLFTAYANTALSQQRVDIGILGQNYRNDVERLKTTIKTNKDICNAQLSAAHDEHQRSLNQTERYKISHLAEIKSCARAKDIEHNCRKIPEIRYSNCRFDYEECTGYFKAEIDACWKDNLRTRREMYRLGIIVE